MMERVAREACSLSASPCIQNLAERRGKKVSINLFGQ